MRGQAIRPLTSPTAVTIHSVFDSDGRRIAEYNEATGALLREYVWNGWEAVAVIEGGTVYFIRADHIGRPVFATNASGVKVWTATYTPFGGVHTSTGALPTARFPGQWFQSESGLHQNWMRDYDPTTGRYLQADPLGLVDGASVYGYVAQSPMMLTDPTGEFIPAAVVGGALLGAGLSILLQLLDNGGDLWCIDWRQVGLDAALGGAFGGAGLLGKGLNPALKGMGIGKPRGSALTNFFENSHFIPSRSLPSSGLGRVLGNSSLNTSYVSYIRHAATDKYAHRFLPKRLKPYIPQIPAPLNLPFRMPPWMYGWVPAWFGDSAGCTCEMPQ